MLKFESGKIVSDTAGREWFVYDVTNDRGLAILQNGYQNDPVNMVAVHFIEHNGKITTRSPYMFDSLVAA